MRRITHALQAIAALVLILALSIAPATDAVTHGPGTLAATSDHAAWHSEQTAQKRLDGHNDSHAHDHGHHTALDHDHSTSVILQTTSLTDPAAPQSPWTAQSQRMASITRDGPRRPPRKASLIV